MIPKRDIQNVNSFSIEFQITLNAILLQCVMPGTVQLGAAASLDWSQQELAVNAENRIMTVRQAEAGETDRTCNPGCSEAGLGGAASNSSTRTAAVRRAALRKRQQLESRNSRRGCQVDVAKLAKSPRSQAHSIFDS